MCITAHQEDDFNRLFSYIPSGGVHVLAYRGQELVSHAVVTTRWLQPEAMAVLAEAVEQHDPRTSQLWFDVATVADFNISPATAALLARRLRQVGVERIVYGSDAAAGDNLRPREGWAAFRRLPLTQDEFARIANNVAPYLG